MSCLDAGGGSGIASVPKLMATYLSVISTGSRRCSTAAGMTSRASPRGSSNQREETNVSIFEARIRERIDSGGEGPSSGRRRRNGRDDRREGEGGAAVDDGGSGTERPPTEGREEFLDSIFASVRYLFASAG